MNLTPAPLTTSNRDSAALAVNGSIQLNISGILSGATVQLYSQLDAASPRVPIKDAAFTATASVKINAAPGTLISASITNGDGSTSVSINFIEYGDRS